MESMQTKLSPDRAEQRAAWLKEVCAFQTYEITCLPADASFRRYYRIKHTVDSYILMDAPPPENCEPFVKIAASIRAEGIVAPHVFQQDLQQGFLLLSDLGDDTLLRILNAENVDLLYGQAIQTLIALQTIQQVPDWTLPHFSAELMWQEWLLHKEWFLTQLLEIKLPTSQETALDACMQQIIQLIMQQPTVFMHRDYHSANLMWTRERQIGVLDFQDAFLGPITYDLVSLLRDCYIDWPTEQVMAFMLAYKKNQPQLETVSDTLFIQWADWMGIQRHLKALLTFARKKVRDQNDHYLQYIPRTLQYIISISALYPALKTLSDFYQTVIKPHYHMRAICVE